MNAEQHLDVDSLADVLADAAPLSAQQHATGCAQCRGALADLRAALPQVSAALSALPSPPMPVDVAAGLHEALRSAVPAVAGAETVTPFPTVESRPARRRRTARWLPAAAAAVVLLAGGVFLAGRLGGETASTIRAGSNAGTKAAPGLSVERNSSGTDYTDRASLAAAVPDLLAGRRSTQDSAALSAPAPEGTRQQQGVVPMAAPDPLARLRDNAGLAECLLALLPPDDASVQPLALDYASFRGRPAMVVVLPGAAANKLDVFVVGPGCSRANDSVLFYTSVDRA